MHRRALLRSGCVAALGVTAGCLDTVDRIVWSGGVGSLHRPGEIRLGDRDPADGVGAGVIYSDADATDEVTATADLPAAEAITDTDWERNALLVVQLSRPADTAASIGFGPGGPERSGLRGLSADADARPWTGVPDSLADADRLEYTLVQGFERPRAFVPRSATITLSGPDGRTLGRIDA
ncbi:hypothetical protein [Natronorubrum bangense]|uniref:Lipoprotein n=2 Tax=Natronorubrum bangense TaxID=61858 RepID=L9WLK6_9EURY|nr:hypothetical protein [Natronorubrum bangense]ELY50081.1 hypothetical protein C494_06250 [Natronorubrum bangense JCM 10635]QCC54184.1 hypothetical protein DV706_06590 [Natronorubrum bangense]